MIIVQILSFCKVLYEKVDFIKNILRTLECIYYLSSCNPCGFI